MSETVFIELKLDDASGVWKPFIWTRGATVGWFGAPGKLEDEYTHVEWITTVDELPYCCRVHEDVRLDEKFVAETAKRVAMDIERTLAEALMEDGETTNEVPKALSALSR